MTYSYVRSFLFSLTIFPLLASFAQSQELSAQEIESFDDRLSELSSRLDQIELAVSDQAFLTEIENAKTDIQELIDGLNNIGRQVSLGQMFLSGQFFTIFGLVFAVAGLISGVVATGMIRGANARILSRLKERVNSEIMGAIDDSSHFITAKTHGQQAFAWWDHYQHQFQMFLREEPYDESIVRDIRLSKDIAAKGLSELDKMSDPLKSDSQTIKLKAELRNHWVYNRTSEALLEQKSGKELNDIDRDELTSEALQCIRNAKLSETSKSWYNFIETGYFCLLKFGEEPEKKEARKSLLSLFEHEKGKYKRTKNKPSAAFLDLAYSCYFPVNNSTGERYDLHKLGRVPQAPRG